jgi:hypothetical protein
MAAPVPEIMDGSSAWKPRPKSNPYLRCFCETGTHQHSRTPTCSVRNITYQLDAAGDSPVRAYLACCLFVCFIQFVLSPMSATPQQFEVKGYGEFFVFLHLVNTDQFLR